MVTAGLEEVIGAIEDADALAVEEAACGVEELAGAASEVETAVLVDVVDAATVFCPAELKALEASALSIQKGSHTPAAEQEATATLEAEETSAPEQLSAIH